MWPTSIDPASGAIRRYDATPVGARRQDGEEQRIDASRAFVDPGRVLVEVTRTGRTARYVQLRCSRSSGLAAQSSARVSRIERLETAVSARIGSRGGGGGGVQLPTLAPIGWCRTMALAPHSRRMRLTLPGAWPCVARPDARNCMLCHASSSRALDRLAASSSPPATGGATRRRATAADAVHRRRSIDRRHAEGAGGGPRHLATARRAVPAAHRALRGQAERDDRRQPERARRRRSPRRASARRARCAGRCTASRSRSRTTSTPPTCRPPAARSRSKG